MVANGPGKDELDEDRARLAMRTLVGVAISALGLLSATHNAVAECDMAMFRANAIFIRATAHCEKNFMDTPAGHHALAISKQCASNMSGEEIKKRSQEGFKELDEVARKSGRNGACRWVDDLERRL